MSSPLAELAALLAPGDAKVAAAVALATTDPTAYLAKYAARLRERAIDRVRPDLAWIALIDALGLAKRLAEIDHRAAYEDVTFAINRLASLPKLRARWSKLGYELDLGIGIAQGFATLGAFGFEGRFDYSAIGSVVNLAARLCAEAPAGCILVDRRTRAALEDGARLAPVGPLALKGFGHPVPAFQLQAVDARG